VRKYPNVVTKLKGGEREQVEFKWVTYLNSL
jgi:hypothetical protein